MADINLGKLIKTLEDRFKKNMHRHTAANWNSVQLRLNAHPQKLFSLSEMEHTGGEPDVIAMDGTTGEVIYCDCSPESPVGRRSLCFDRAALEARKENKPRGSAAELAIAMGVEILTEEQYRDLQRLEEFDRKTSSWIATPADIRKLGGALFCDRRYDQVFLYHNGAESYYATRGFRARLRV